MALEGVAFSYDRGAPVLRGITMSVEPGERLGVLGPNGGGKSTLLKIILGLLEPDSGVARVFGRHPVLARDERLIGYLPQRTTAELRFPLTARQVVRMAATAHLPPLARPPADVLEAAAEAMDAVDAAPLAERPVGSLSGGELQRVMIARALAVRPRLLILDEPTVGIDVKGQARFAEMLSRVRDRLGLAIITVSHDLRTIAVTSDRVACLSRTLHYHDTPRGLTKDVLAEVFSHDIEAFVSARGEAL